MQPAAAPCTRLPTSPRGWSPGGCAARCSPLQPRALGCLPLREAGRLVVLSLLKLVLQEVAFAAGFSGGLDHFGPSEMELAGAPLYRERVVVI